MFHFTELHAFSYSIIQNDIRHHMHAAFCSNHSSPDDWQSRIASLQMGLPDTPIVSYIDGRKTRDPAKVALRKQQHEYRERAITPKAFNAVWDGLKVAVKHHLKHHGGDPHNTHDVHRAEKVQLDRIQRINATWIAKIETKLFERDLEHFIDLDSSMTGVPW
jgi:hypothetical protein